MALQIKAFSQYFKIQDINFKIYDFKFSLKFTIYVNLVETLADTLSYISKFKSIVIINGMHFTRAIR